MLVRDAMVVVLCVLVVRSVLRPATDPVRILGLDDPDWPERTRHLQRSGAGRAGGAESPTAADAETASAGPAPARGSCRSAVRGGACTHRARS